MCVLLFVAEPDLFAIRQEDKWNAELVGISAALSFTRAQVDAGALGLEDGQRSPLSVEERVVRFTAIIERILEADAEAVGQPPIGVP